MKQKALNEEQMREYVEKEVCMSLLNEEINNGISAYLTGGKGKLYEESFLSKLIPGFSWETIIGTILGRIAIEPILRRMLKKLGVAPEGELGKTILRTVSMYGGSMIGDWVDKTWNPIGASNNPQLN